MPELSSQLEAYARFVRAGRTPVSADSVMAAPPVPESPRRGGGGGRRRYLALVGTAVVVVLLAGAVALATRHHDSGLPVRTGPAPTSGASFCDDMRQAMALPIKTSDTDTLAEFAPKVIAAYRNRLPYFERAASVVPPEIADDFRTQLDEVRAMAGLDPKSPTDQAKVVEDLTSGSPDDRAATARSLTYVRAKCHVDPTIVELPGGSIISKTPTSR